MLVERKSSPTPPSVPSGTGGKTTIYISTNMLCLTAQGRVKEKNEEYPQDTVFDLLIYKKKES
jgi:hypothetical protein